MNVKTPLTHSSCRVGEATHSSGESVGCSGVLQAAVGRPKHRQEQQKQWENNTRHCARGYFTSGRVRWGLYFMSGSVSFLLEFSSVVSYTISLQSQRLVFSLVPFILQLPCAEAALLSHIWDYDFQTFSQTLWRTMQPTNLVLSTVREGSVYCPTI